jgi:hypothetical protein
MSDSNMSNQNLYLLVLELIIPDSQVIVPYSAKRIVLTGARHTPSLTELDPKPIAEEYGWECLPPLYANESQDAIRRRALYLPPWQSRGFVVVTDMYRNAIAAPQYNAITEILISQNKALRESKQHYQEHFLPLVILGHNTPNYEDQLKLHFPHLADDFREVNQKYCDLCEAIDASFKDLKVGHIAL